MWFQRSLMAFFLDVEISALQSFFLEGLRLCFTSNLIAVGLDDFL